jgi:hypothetical protein
MTNILTHPDYVEILNQNTLLKKENETLQQEIVEIKAHLKRYTAPERNRRFYQAHKKEIYEKSKESNLKWKQENKDRVKLHNRKAYLKKKQKILEEKEREDESQESKNNS